MIAALLETLELGLRNMRGYPLRTLLTVLGVVCGVASVVIMRAVGAGAEAEILRGMGRLGIDNIVVNSVKPPEKPRANEGRNWINRYGLRFSDVERIKATVPGLARVLPVHGRTERVWAGSRRVEASVLGVVGEHMARLGLEVVRGRQICDLDGEGLARVCVARASLFRELGILSDPLGTYLAVGDDLYRVIGLLADEPVAGYARKALALDRRAHEIYVPFATLVGREGIRSVQARTGSFEATEVELSQAIIGVRRIDDVVETAASIRSALDRFHEDARDFEVVVPLEYLRQRQKTQEVFNYAFLAIASVSLIVGGIGIANIMLATVTERTREIGIRRALGARRADIVIQFLAETTTIAAAGGALGLVAAFALDAALRAATGWTTIIAPGTLALGLGVSLGVGILSGIYPARRAAFLDPIEALRR